LLIDLIDSFHHAFIYRHSLTGRFIRSVTNRATDQRAEDSTSITFSGLCM